MKNASLLICVIVSLTTAPALAQSGVAIPAYNPAAPTGVITSGRGDELPGGLSAKDVIGKRLLDGDGNNIGHIEKLSADGRSAVVRPPQSGRPILIDMAELSLGTGPHTVIDESNSGARALNQQSAAKARMEETHTTTVVPAPAVTTTTTTYSESSTQSRP